MECLKTATNHYEGSLSRNSENADDELTDKIAAEEQAGGGISLRDWNAYFRAGSTLVGLSFMVFVMLLSQISDAISQAMILTGMVQYGVRQVAESLILLALYADQQLLNYEITPRGQLL
uniref:Uncharacterized protein n=1 Tax=Glossina palpalis gambiensis TaxID=67801 RepID=A0A1B0C641_9MUSC